MGGHAVPAVTATIADRAGRGATSMLPTADAAWVGAELARRFGLPVWQFALSATDANRFALRIARLATGRRRILVFDWCYHGTVDETLVTLDADGRVVARDGSIGRARRPGADDGGGAVQRRRRARAGARRWRHRVRARRAGAHQHRHRAAGCRVPRRPARAHPRHRHAARPRRDAHDLRRARRLHRPPTGWRPTCSSSASRSAGGVPAAAYGLSAAVADRGRRAVRRAVDRRERHRWHARRQRPVRRRDARRAVDDAARRGLRDRDPAGRAVHGRRRRGDRRPRPAVARATARLPRRVLVRSAAARRRGRGRRRRRRPRGVPAPVRAQPRACC